jgi:hypothetical protein
MRSLAMALLYPLRYLAWELEGSEREATAASVRYSDRYR